MYVEKNLTIFSSLLYVIGYLKLDCGSNQVLHTHCEKLVSYKMF